MIDGNIRLLKLARWFAGLSYVLAGVSVTALHVVVNVPRMAFIVAATAAWISFIGTATTARRLRETISRTDLSPRPTWREMWPDGLLTAPLFTMTWGIAVYTAVAAGTNLLSFGIGSAVLPASVSIASTILHIMVPEIMIIRANAGPGANEHSAYK